MESGNVVKGWRTVSLPESLLKDVEKIVASGRYSSLSEFIREAVREKLKEITAQGVEA